MWASLSSCLKGRTRPVWTPSNLSQVSMRLMLQTESHSEQCWHKLSVTTQGTAVNATADLQIKNKALFVLFACNCHWSQRFLWLNTCVICRFICLFIVMTYTQNMIFECFWNKFIMLTNTSFIWSEIQ